jgi:hypothetical protein
MKIPHPDCDLKAALASFVRLSAVIGLLWAAGSSYLRQAVNWKPDKIRSIGDLIQLCAELTGEA